MELPPHPSEQEGALPIRRNVRFLAVGINKYAAAKGILSKIPQLNAAEADARRLHALILDTFPCLPVSNQSLLLGENATCDAVRQELKRLFPHENERHTDSEFVEMSENDIVIASFSGHGTSSQHLVFYDTDPNKPEISGIFIDEIVSRINGTQAAIKILIIDACFSGEKRNIISQMLSGGAERSFSGGNVNARNSDPLNGFSGDALMIFRASQWNQRAWEYHGSEDHYGLLSHVFHDQLCQDGGPHSALTFGEMISTGVRSLATTHGLVQEPSVSISDNCASIPSFKGANRSNQVNSEIQKEFLRLKRILFIKRITIICALLCILAGGSSFVYSLIKEVKTNKEDAERQRILGIIKDVQSLKKDSHFFDAFLKISDIAEMLRNSEIEMPEAHAEIIQSMVDPHPIRIFGKGEIQCQPLFLSKINSMVRIFKNVETFSVEVEDEESKLSRIFDLKTKFSEISFIEASEDQNTLFVLGKLSDGKLISEVISLTDQFRQRCILVEPANKLNDDFPTIDIGPDGKHVIQANGRKIFLYDLLNDGKLKECTLMPEVGSRASNQAADPIVSLHFGPDSESFFVGIEECGKIFKYSLDFKLISEIEVFKNNAVGCYPVRISRHLLVESPMTRKKIIRASDGTCIFEYDFQRSDIKLSMSPDDNWIIGQTNSPTEEIIIFKKINGRFYRLDDVGNKWGQAPRKDGVISGVFVSFSHNSQYLYYYKNVGSKHGEVVLNRISLSGITLGQINQSESIVDLLQVSVEMLCGKIQSPNGNPIQFSLESELILHTNENKETILSTFRPVEFPIQKNGEDILQSSRLIPDFMQAELQALGKEAAILIDWRNGKIEMNTGWKDRIINALDSPKIFYGFESSGRDVYRMNLDSPHIESICSLPNQIRIRKLLGWTKDGKSIVFEDTSNVKRILPVNDSLKIFKEVLREEQK